MRILAPCSLLLLLPLSLGSAQASYVEGFQNMGPAQAGANGPQELIDRGWEFRNQSSPLGFEGFDSGQTLTPFEGSGYLSITSFSTGSFGGSVSNWALLPVVDNQLAGDQVSLHLQRTASSNLDLIELRYSPGGGTSTGSSVSDVGDFTTLLSSTSPVVGGWNRITANLPGGGRLAIRYVVSGACNFGCFTSHVGVDLISVGPLPPPACNTPPLPSTGETVTWTKAGGPWQICADIGIAFGSTVYVEAGTTIMVDPGFQIQVAGLLLAQGSAAEPILLSKSGISPALVVAGEAQLDFVQVQGQLHVAHGGTLIVRDSDFSGVGLGTDASVGGQNIGTYVQIERCSFSGEDLTVTDGTLVVRSTTLSNASISLLRGYVYFENVDIDGGNLSIVRERYSQPAFLDDLSITNSAQAALELQGWNFLIGNNTTLQGNLRPVSLLGGLLPGSRVPVLGNLQNYVDVGGGGILGNSVWAALPIPYVVNGIGTVGGSNLLIEAGATVQFQPGSAVIYFGGAELRARGLPGAPVTFQAVIPGLGWDRFKFQSHDGTAHFEHCLFEDAQVGLQSDNAFLEVDASIFRNNQNGVWTNSGGLMTVRGTQFISNIVGGHVQSGLLTLNGNTSPNSFVGNQLGVEGGTGNARNNWWGAASGPTHASNPGGTGDAATSGVPVLPFRTTFPNYADNPPRVRMARASAQMDKGQRVILNWEVEEDSSVASQRILFSDHGHGRFGLLVGDLPGDLRSIELVVPSALPSSLNTPSYFRVIAVDDAGQQGWDEVVVRIPYVEDLGPASLSFLTDFSSGFTFGDVLNVAWTQTGMSGTWNLSVVSDSEFEDVGYGGGTTLTENRDVAMPYLSTDSARISIEFTLGGGGRTRTFLSPRFTIRPNSRVPDAAPSIRLLTPRAGQSFVGGGCVPVSWTASDDQGLRAIRVQASYDAGRSWQELAELNGSAVSFAWQLPASQGIANVLLRAIAVDKRFQNTSDIHVMSIRAGNDGRCKLSTRPGAPPGF